MLPATPRLIACAAMAALVALAMDACSAESLLRNGSFEGTTKYWPEDGDVVQDAPKHGSFCVRLREKGKLRSGAIRVPPASTVTVSLWARAEKEGRLDITLCPSNRGVAQRTEALAGDVVADVQQQVQVFHTALASLDTAQDPVHPVCALTARDAFATRLVAVKSRQARCRPHDAGSLIDCDHGPRPKHRASFKDRLVIQVGLQSHAGRHHWHR